MNLPELNRRTYNLLKCTLTNNDVLYDTLNELNQSAPVDKSGIDIAENKVSGGVLSDLESNILNLEKALDYNRILTDAFKEIINPDENIVGMASVKSTN